MAETDFKKLHRYNEIVKALGYKASDFEGKSPGETKALIDRALQAAKYRRTDADIIMERGISVTLGKTSYEIKQRTIDDEAAWCEKCGVVAARIVELLFERGGPALQELLTQNLNTDPKEALGAGLALLKSLLPQTLPFIFGRFSKDVIDLFFAYSGIDREAVRNDGATYDQLLLASSEVFNAYILPFMAGMIRMMVAMARQTGIMQGMIAG